MKFQIVKYLIPLITVISCNDSSEINETSNIKPTDTLEDIKIKPPGTIVNFTIGKIPEFDTIYYGINKFDTIICENYYYAIYSKKILNPISTFNDQLIIPKEFEGIIFKYHDKNCREEISSEYGLSQRVKHELPSKGNPCFKDFRNDLIFCEKIDTLDHKVWYSGATYRDSIYLDFSAIYQEGDLIIHTNIYNSLNRLKFNEKRNFK